MTTVEKIAEYFTNRAVPRWENTNLSAHEQTFIRDKPKDYLMACIELCKRIGARTIVEIGSIRQQMHHPIESFNPYCCNNGHSTAFWSWFLGESASIYSVESIQAPALLHSYGVLILSIWTELNFAAASTARLTCSFWLF